jgi:hypothetical protein
MKSASLGMTTNSALAFVNLLGYHALVLGSGNVASCLGCLTGFTWCAVFARREIRVTPP